MVEALKKPELHEQRNIKAINFQMYERYLPSAFDESLSILEKLNKMVYKLNELGELTNEMLERWNDVIKWILNDGLETIINKKLEKWYNEGRFDEILESILFRDTITLTVGENGDYDELQDCLSYLEKKPVYPLHVDVKLLDKYIMKKPVKINGKDLSFVTITGEQRTTRVEIEAKDISSIAGYKELPVIHAVNTIMPYMDVKFEYHLNKKDNRYVCGMMLDNSNVSLKPYNGFDKFPNVGLYGLNNSIVTANDCSFQENGNREEIGDSDDAEANAFGSGLKVQASTLTAHKTTCNNCGQYGFWVQQTSSARITGSEAKNCGHHNLVVSQASICTARNSTFTESPDNNVVITTNSQCDIKNCDTSGAGANNVVAQLNSSIYFQDSVSNNSGISGLNITKHSFASAQDATLNNNSRNGLDVKDGSSANFNGGKANGNGENGVYVLDNSSLHARNCTLNNNNIGIYCYGGLMSARSAEVKNSIGDGVRSYDGGRVIFDHGTVEKSGEHGLHASRGELWAGKATSKNNNGIDVKASYGSKVSCSELHTTSGDVQTLDCTSSSIIQANRIHGSAKANKPKNEINNQGIIFSNI